MKALRRIHSFFTPTAEQKAKFTQRLQRWGAWKPAAGAAARRGEEQSHVSLVQIGGHSQRWLPRGTCFTCWSSRCSPWQYKANGHTECYLWNHSASKAWLGANPSCRVLHWHLADAAAAAAPLVCVYRANVPAHSTNSKVGRQEGLASLSLQPKRKKEKPHKHQIYVS